MPHPNLYSLTHNPNWVNLKPAQARRLRSLESWYRLHFLGCISPIIGQHQNTFIHVLCLYYWPNVTQCVHECVLHTFRAVFTSDLITRLTVRCGVGTWRHMTVFHISCVSSLGQKNIVRWYLGDCRPWGRAPVSTRAPTVSKGRGASWCVSWHHITFGSWQGKGLKPDQFI